MLAHVCAFAPVIRHSAYLSRSPKDFFGEIATSLCSRYSCSLLAVM